MTNLIYEIIKYGSLSYLHGYIMGKNDANNNFNLNYELTKEVQERINKLEEIYNRLKELLPKESI